MSFKMLETQSSGTSIKVIGVGGAGGNAVAHMIEKNVKGVNFICANTDAQALSESTADLKLQLGESGLGAGAQPEKGKVAAESEKERIAEALQGAHMVFITAGMGGGTGTGAAPVVAEIAKELGALTVAVVTKPFNYEGKKRKLIAEEGIKKLEKSVDSIIVILNEKLISELGNEITHCDAFAEADNVLYNAVAGIAEIINVKGYTNVDFEDVRTVMSAPGKAMMGTAAKGGDNRAIEAAENAVKSPLLEGVDLKGAKGILVNISASKSLKLNEITKVMNSIESSVDEDADIIHGVVYDDSLENELRVTVVATGLGDRSVYEVTKPETEIEEFDDLPKAATGTDDGQPPDVWIKSQSDLAARKDAASKIEAFEKDGVELLDIPAFLRKQAD